MGVEVEQRFVVFGGHSRRGIHKATLYHLWRKDAKKVDCGQAAVFLTRDSVYYNQDNIPEHLKPCGRCVWI